MLVLSATQVTTREQLDQCLRIRKEVFVLEQGVSIEEELDNYDESPEACIHVLLTDNDEPVGTGRLKTYEGSIAKLQRIAVLASERGRGAGAAVVVGLEDAAKRAGYTGAVLDAQTHAESFYSKLGYATVSPEIFMDAGIPHVQMSKSWA